MIDYWNYISSLHDEWSWIDSYNVDLPFIFNYLEYCKYSKSIKLYLCIYQFNQDIKKSYIFVFCAKSACIISMILLIYSLFAFAIADLEFEIELIKTIIIFFTVPSGLLSLSLLFCLEEPSQLKVVNVQAIYYPEYSF